MACAQRRGTALVEPAAMRGSAPEMVPESDASSLDPNIDSIPDLRRDSAVRERDTVARCLLRSSPPLHLYQTLSHVFQGVEWDFELLHAFPSDGRRRKR